MEQLPPPCSPAGKTRSKPSPRAGIGPGPPLQNRNRAIVKPSLSRTLSLFPSCSENSLEMLEFFSNGKAWFVWVFFFFPGFFIFFFPFSSHFQTKPSLSGLCLTLPSAGSLLWPCPEHLGPYAGVGCVSHPGAPAVPASDISLHTLQQQSDACIPPVCFLAASRCSGAPLPFLLPPSLIQTLPLCI